MDADCHYKSDIHGVIHERIGDGALVDGLEDTFGLPGQGFRLPLGLPDSA
jgi:hypothetical protein